MAGPEITPGTRIADFVVDGLIGVGGMARVYRAEQVGVNRAVALKVLSPAFAADAAFVRRFQREAGLMRDLDHPAVLPVYAAGEADGRVYLATRLVVGSTLAQLLADERMERSRALEVLRAVAEGLDHAHGRGIIHRDVKPANILVDAVGRPFLSDFGISKAVGVTSTVTGQYFGTPRYMAPEQAGGNGTTGHRADLYSLACVAFEMLAGSVPYADTDTVPLLLAHASRPIPQASAIEPSLPRAFDRVFARGLAKRPADRFPSGRSFVDELETAATRPRPRPWLGTLRVRGVAVAAAAAVVTVVAAGFALGGARLAEDPAPRPVTLDAFRPSPRDLAALPRGDMIYRAALDGTPGGFVDSPATRATSAKESVHYVPGSLDLELFHPAGETYTELDVANGVKTFIEEMDVVVRPGSRVELCWSVRWAVPQQLANFACIDTASRSAAFSVFRRGQGKQRIGEPAVLPGLFSGTVRLATVVRERQLSLYLNGQLVLDVPNNDVRVAGTTPGIELESTDGVGAVRITGLRLYELRAT